MRRDCKLIIHTTLDLIVNIIFIFVSVEITVIMFSILSDRLLIMRMSMKGETVNRTEKEKGIFKEKTRGTFASEVLKIL